jgi:hypothetical protein
MRAEGNNILNSETAVFLPDNNGMDIKMKD